MNMDVRGDSVEYMRALDDKEVAYQAETYQGTQEHDAVEPVIEGNSFLGI